MSKTPRGSSSSITSPHRSASIKNIFSNIDIPLLFQSMKCDTDVEPKYEVSKYRLKYEAIFNVEEIEKAFHQFLNTEYNT